MVHSDTGSVNHDVSSAQPTSPPSAPPFPWGMFVAVVTDALVDGR